MLQLYVYPQADQRLDAAGTFCSKRVLGCVCQFKAVFIAWYTILMLVVPRRVRPRFPAYLLGKETDCPHWLWRSEQWPWRWRAFPMFPWPRKLVGSSILMYYVIDHMHSRWTNWDMGNIYKKFSACWFKTPSLLRGWPNMLKTSQSRCEIHSPLVTACPTPP